MELLVKRVSRKPFRKFDNGQHIACNNVKYNIIVCKEYVVAPKTDPMYNLIKRYNQPGGGNCKPGIASNVMRVFPLQ